MTRRGWPVSGRAPSHAVPGLLNGPPSLKEPPLSALGPFSAIVFDMDGVLLDTEPLYKQAMHQACTDLGFEMNEDLHNAQIGAPADASARMLIEFFGADFPLTLYNQYTAKTMQALTADDVPLKAGVRELLFELNARNIPAAVATSTASPIAPDRLKRAGIFDKFHAVVTRNDVQNGKPHPEPFLTAAARLGIDPAQCIALEDSHNGIRSAHGAGMMPIMVPDLLAPNDEITALCHAVLPSLHHVREAAFGATPA